MLTPDDPKVLAAMAEIEAGLAAFAHAHVLGPLPESASATAVFGRLAEQADELNELDLDERRTFVERFFGPHDSGYRIKDVTFEAEMCEGTPTMTIKMLMRPDAETVWMNFTLDHCDADGQLR